MTTIFRKGALTCALLTTTALATPALAQTSQPAHRAIDANGVDLISGTYPFSIVEGSIGSGAGQITIERQGASGGGVGNWQNMYAYRSVTGGGTLVTLTLGDRSETFLDTGSGYTSLQGSGSTLTGGNHSDFTYTLSDGTVMTFGAPVEDQYGVSNLCSHSNSNLNSCYAVATNLTQPNGLTLTYAWDVHANCASQFNPDGSLDCTYAWRLDTVGNSLGYSVDFSYASDSVSLHQNPSATWYKRSGEVLSNGSVTRTVSNTFVSSTVTDLTDASGRTWRITDGTNSLGIRRPGSSSDDISVTFSGGVVTQVVRDGITTAYSRSVSGNSATTTITDAASNVTTVVADTSIARITSVTDALSHVTSFTYDGSGRLTRVTQPEGNYINFSYDGRGNVTEVRRVAKSGSGLPDMVTSASYSTTCSDPSCNRPLTTTDERGNVTEYTYDSTHGGVLTVTAPAPTPGATRPQIRYSYTLTYGEYQLTGVSACATGAGSACVGTADETRTAIAYDTNGNATSVERRSGNTTGTGALSAITAYTYDALGDLLTEDGPLAGTDDTTRYRYNGARQIIGVVGPDPDGSGSLHHRASRITYAAHGQISRVEHGTVNSQSDTDWANFSTLRQADIEYDSHQRPVIKRLVSGSTTYQLTQQSYDSLGRAQCVAQRMNPSEFATSSLPSDACTLDTQGSYGPDRIIRTTYDAISRPTLVQTGYGVSGETAEEIATAYSANGRISTVTDAEGNRTSHTYDGHDRLSRTYMPSPTTDNTSSTTDYEELTYATVSSGTRSTSFVASRRLRDGTSISYGYDALGRPILKDTPNATYYDPDITYVYDLLGRLIGATSNHLHDVTIGYDALGRQVSETSYYGTKTMQYDLAGRMTRLTWPDSFQVGYVYDVAGEVTEIRESPSGANLALATYSYDDLGQRTVVSRYNGTSTSYSYDNVSRSTQIVQNLNGTTYDLTLDLSRNPAGQIASVTRSNDAFAWTSHYAVNRSYTANGLNQYTAAGSVTPSYDARGNLTQSGASSFSYTSENRMYGGPGGSGTIDDPLGRLMLTAGAGPQVRLDMIDHTLITELDSSHVIQRRYVPGLRADEIVVWYEGSGTSDRRWLHADERGSVIAVSDGSGNAVAVNSYDEYGIPGATNSGRFQYSGQAWIPELGMYYYRARMYSPTLGRFMQTDPIGFAGGMNIYGYVLNDPINLIDPSGMGPEDPPCDTDECTGGDIWVKGSQPPPSAQGWARIGSVRGWRPRMVGQGGEAIVVTANACLNAINEPGPVQALSLLNLEGTFAIGMTGTFGLVQNTATGTRANFYSFGFTAGLSAGAASMEWNNYSSMADFVGYADSFNASLSLPFSSMGMSNSLSYSRTYNLDGNLIAEGAGFSLTGLFGRIGAAGSFTETSIYNCSLGPRSGM